MIRLIKAAERREIELGYGVKVVVRPLSTRVHRAAQHSADRIARQLAYETGLVETAGGSIHDIPAPHDQDGMRGLRDQLLLQALARHAIIEWEGVAGEDGIAIDPTPERIDALIRDYPVLADRFEVEYLRPVYALLAEGNVSGAAPNGTSAVAPTTADAA
jgi:hypothetical protein